MKKFIAVAGNVGVGKSTLTRLLSEYLCWEPFFEAVDDNPYLADFYKDMRTWTFHSQIYFLSRRLSHHRQIIERPGTVIQDRTVYEDAEIFARNLYLQGHMTNRDWQELLGPVPDGHHHLASARPGDLFAGLGAGAAGAHSPARPRL